VVALSEPQVVQLREYVEPPALVPVKILLIVLASLLAVVLLLGGIVLMLASAE